MRAIGLDGREIEIEPERDAANEPDAITDDILIFDRLPKWARDALRELPSYSIKAREIAPHIQSGVVNRFNIADQLRANDARGRAYFAEKDRANGLA